MAYVRRRRYSQKRTPRTRRVYKPRRRMYRKKYSKYSSRNRPATGIPIRKFIKVRKDIMYTVPTAATSWNAIIAGGAQVANAAQLSYWTGNSVSPVDTIVDQNSYTGMNEWFAFYNRYIVCGSKIRVSLLNNISGAIMATLVPTIDFNLGAQGTAGTTTFDAGGIEPGELPYAKRVLLNGLALEGGSVKTLQSYCSVKKMLAVKDLSDVAWDDGADFNPKPFVPQVTSAATAATGIQPNSGSGQNGVYWNLVLQNLEQNQTAVPGTPVSPAVQMRITMTSYLMFTERRILATTG